MSTQLVLSEEDVADFNKAMSLAYVGAIAENCDGDTGVHLASLCDSIVDHLSKIRNRHTPDDRCGVLLGGAA